jgi:hypothetical protein
MKQKHKWHCGICHSDCKVLKGKKGTKYIYCPVCDKQVSYYNALPLLAAALPVIKGVAGRALLTAGATYVGSKIASGLGTKKEDEPKTIITDNKDIPNHFISDKYYIERALRGN